MDAKDQAGAIVEDMLNCIEVIKVVDLNYEYPGLRALEDINFSIAPGSITALVGPNGAGKTTLMRCLAGLTKPLQGEISVYGVDVIKSPRESHLLMGYLADSFGVYNDLTVRQCLTYVAMAQRIEQESISKRVEQVARDLDLEHKLENQAQELSRGMRQRLAIAQAIIHEPKVLILDEPASGLDPEARFELAELFVRLRDAGMTLLVSSHILAELEQYSTEMLIIDQGRIVDHSPISSDQKIKLKHLQLDLLRSNKKAVGILGNNKYVQDLVVENERFLFGFTGSANQQQSLLKELIMADIPVVSLQEVKQNLQSAYLAKIKKGGLDEN